MTVSKTPKSAAERKRADRLDMLVGSTKCWRPMTLTA